MDYELIRSKRKTMELSIDEDLKVIVRAPERLSQKKIDQFVEDHRAWIEKHQKQKEEWLKAHKVTPEKEEQWRKEAREYLPLRTAYYAGLMGLKPTGVKITSAKKRFGSCNSKNSICYSWRLMQYPSEAIDYVIVHELSHIVHKNHGREFYGLIARYLPDYKEREKLLKR